MSAQEKDKDNADFDDVPIVTYSNRIQKHMFKLTEELGEKINVGIAEKRRLRLLIANLPPKAKEVLQGVYKRCEEQCNMPAVEFDRMYGEVSDWIYENILQDAFRAKPIFGRNGKI